MSNNVSEFHRNWLGTFWDILRTDRQTDIGTKAISTVTLQNHTKWLLCYVETTGIRSDVFETEIADPERTYKKIFDLKDDTEYEITIWALTAAGKGQPKVIVEVTVPSSGIYKERNISRPCFFTYLRHIITSLHTAVIYCFTITEIRIKIINFRLLLV